MFHSSIRRGMFRLAALAIVALPMLGCTNGLFTLVYLLKGTDVDPEFKDLKDKKVAVVCRPADTLMYSSSNVGRELAAAHLMFLPTRGENFGHAIIEALRSGCPVLISDQTPWRGLEDDRAGWILPLDEAERFRAVVQQVIDMPEADWAEWSAGARRFGERFACDPAHVEANRQLFLRAAGRLTDLEPAAPSDERPAPRPGVRPKE